MLKGHPPRVIYISKYTGIRRLAFGVWGLGFGFRVWALEFRILGVIIEGSGLSFRARGSRIGDRTPSLSCASFLPPASRFGVYSLGLGALA